ncbi:type IV pili methyl-accepting chemotaxis transducer N-terminal domain-containing protein [Alcaligenaceae bacterium]|nr:type IV pili methyl-accepting chemotaxis transducer N-terminal domain-containing protein [Alcaligenaceae bacterium]
MNETNTKTIRFPAHAGRLPSLGIAQKIGAFFLALLLIAAVNVVLVERMMQKSDSVADTINVAGKLRMLGQRVALQTMNHGNGVGAGEVEVRQLMRDFETGLAALSDGGYVFGMYIEGLSSLHRTRLDAVREQWTVYRRSAHQLLQEVGRYRNEAGSLAAAAFAARGSVNMLMEDMASQSTRLLERTETLMNGILVDV